ncbi:MAG: carboxypeptidase-like regulatory domain-containing protein [Dehalococcoidia bacterium]
MVSSKTIIWSFPRLCGMLFVWFLLTTLLSGAASAQRLDETWTVSVNGQTVPVNPNGTFRISNVAAPDLFGPGGPGTRPDFLSDDLLRLTGLGLIDGVRSYVVSDFFQIRQGQVFIIGNLRISMTPPIVPDSIALTAVKPTLTAINQTTNVQVLASLSDGTTKDLSLRAEGTVYRTSNARVVTVGQDGLLTARGEGLAFITASNQGTTSVTRINVVPGDPLTQVIGFVELENGTPVAGASVTVSGTSSTATSGSDGSFAISGVPTQLGLLKVSASLEPSTGPSLAGSSEDVIPEPGGLTDAGVVVLKPVTGVKTTITFDEFTNRFPVSYTESGMTVRSLYPFAAHVHLGDNNRDTSPDLLNHGGCCSTPYVFDVGGPPFTVVSMDVVGFRSGVNTFTSSSNAVFAVTESGTVTFPTTGFRNITSLRWNTTGQMTIDNLVILK